MTVLSGRITVEAGERIGPNEYQNALDQLVHVFANSSARDAAYGTDGALAKTGEIVFLTGTQQFQYWTGSAWAQAGTAATVTAASVIGSVSTSPARTSTRKFITSPDGTTLQWSDGAGVTAGSIIALLAGGPSFSERVSFIRQTGGGGLERADPLTGLRASPSAFYASRADGATARTAFDSTTAGRADGVVAFYGNTAPSSGADFAATVNPNNYPTGPTGAVRYIAVGEKAFEEDGETIKTLTSGDLTTLQGFNQFAPAKDGATVTLLAPVTALRRANGSNPYWIVRANMRLDAGADFDTGGWTARFVDEAPSSAKVLLPWSALYGDIPAGKIMDDTVTLSMMAPGTAGRVIGYDSSGNPAELTQSTGGGTVTAAAIIAALASTPARSDTTKFLAQTGASTLARADALEELRPAASAFYSDYTTLLPSGGGSFAIYTQAVPGAADTPVAVNSISTSAAETRTLLFSDTQFTESGDTLAALASGDLSSLTGFDQYDPPDATVRLAISSALAPVRYQLGSDWYWRLRCGLQRTGSFPSGFTGRFHDTTPNPRQRILINMSEVRGTVGTGRITDDAVTQDKIADDAVGAAQIADSAVSTAALADRAVTPAKASTDFVLGSDLYASADRFQASYLAYTTNANARFGTSTDVRGLFTILTDGGDPTNSAHYVHPSAVPLQSGWTRYRFLIGKIADLNGQDYVTLAQQDVRNLLSAYDFFLTDHSIRLEFQNIPLAALAEVGPTGNMGFGRYYDVDINIRRAGPSGSNFGTGGLILQFADAIPTNKRIVIPSRDVYFAPGAISTAALADGAVTAAKIANNAVGQSEIAAGAVTSTELATSSVSTAKIVDGDVTLSKMATGTANRYLGYDGSGNPAELTAPSGGGSGITVEDEGTALATAATTLDFVGRGVVASGSGAEKTITINPLNWTQLYSGNPFPDTGITGLSREVVTSPSWRGYVELLFEWDTTPGQGTQVLPLSMHTGLVRVAQLAALNGVLATTTTIANHSVLNGRAAYLLWTAGLGAHGVNVLVPDVLQIAPWARTGKEASLVLQLRRGPSGPGPFRVYGR